MLAGSELGETAIATIGDDRLDAGQVSQVVFEQLATDPNIVWSSRISDPRRQQLVGAMRLA